MIDASRRSGLEPEEIERFRTHGFVASIDALSADEVIYYAGRLQEFFDREGGRPDAMLRHKPYLRFKWVSDLVRHPRVVDAVEKLLGPNILAYRGTFFIKAAGDPSVVPWHQDRMQNQLDPAGFVSAWIAITDSGPENGCMRVIPSSHHRGDLPHALNTGPNKTLQLGQAISEPIAEERAVDVVLRAGQISLHHGRLIHGSCGNPSQTARVGLAVRYACPAAATAAGDRPTATLVRGEDRDRRFEHEPVPLYDDDPASLEWHARSMLGYAKGLIRETARNPTRQGIVSVVKMAVRPNNLRLAARLLRPRKKQVVSGPDLSRLLPLSQASKTDRKGRERNGSAAAESHGSSRRTADWAMGPVVIACTSNDSTSVDWLSEFFQPWITPTERAADWRIEITSSRAAYADMCARWPLETATRGCFALDQRTSSLPACNVDSLVQIANRKRSCFFVVRPGEVTIVADPATPRWRFAAMRIIREIVTTRLRTTELDVHAAAVESGGRAVLICGSKFAGKTTLAIHLLLTGRCRLIANDRVFVHAGVSEGAGRASAYVLGVPTAVKIRPGTVQQFPELRRGLSRVATPYLYTLEELARGEGEMERSASAQLALTQSQLARQLRVEVRGGAPPGTIVFPEVCGSSDGLTIERLSPDDVATRLRASLYGERPESRAPTLFEEIEGGPYPPLEGIANAMAETICGFRVILGRRAYEEPAGADRILDTVLER